MMAMTPCVAPGLSAPVADVRAWMMMPPFTVAARSALALRSPTFLVPCPIRLRFEVRAFIVVALPVKIEHRATGEQEGVQTGPRGNL